MNLFFGIDMASKSFVAHNLDKGLTDWQNQAGSIRKFLKGLPAGATIALESTGGYGKLLAEMACEAGFTVYMVQPAKIKRFREAGPDKGKSDKIDAMAISHYIETYHQRLHPYSPLPTFEARLRRLARTRDGIVRKLASLRKQLASLGDSPQAIKRTVAGLAQRVDELTKEIEGMLAEAPDAKLLATIPGVKTCMISAVLPILRTIPFKDKYALDSFAGMDLRVNESGKFKGKRRMSKQGDKHLRRAAFMAALAGTRSKAWGAITAN